MWASKFFAALFAGLVLAPAALFAASPLPVKAVEIHLDPEVKVGGEQVVLGDVATIYAKSLQDFHALSALVISRIPDDKQEVRLPRSYLESRAKSLLPEGSELVVRGPAEIVFKLERLGLKTPDLASEIVRLGRASGKIPEGVEVEVQPVSGAERLVGLTLAGTRIEAATQQERWKGDLSFKLTRLDGQGDGAPIWVRAKVRWFQKAWVAGRGLAYSETPSPDGFSLARMETTGLREDPVTGTPEELAELLRNSRMKRALAANAPLFPSIVERRPDAKPGAPLRVVFVSEGGVRVTAEGLLVGSGLIGSEVKARMRSSKKMVTGKLVSPSVMEVSL